MNELLIGGIATAAVLVGLFFFRFWRATRDRFFLYFATAFWLEGLNRLVVSRVFGPDEEQPLYYLIRLVAYGLIIMAIVEKNRRSGKR
jgi:hypothetical protein